MQKDRLNDLVAVVIDDGEKEELYKICKEYDIPILYDELFQNDINYHLWGLSEDGIGLIGTEVIRRTKKIIHGTFELKCYLEAVRTQIE